ncbi:MAG: ThiF family adenylyltransferase [Anaeroplasmataceae bacterium]|nr:ThiF family adenylyltransferase [Anaeroplasmataceae bacterium]
MEERSIPILGEKTIQQLNMCHIAIFGVGGVGGYTVEMLARQGVGQFSLIDFDVIQVSNKNRQIIALDSTLGKLKVEVMKQRILDINPNAIVHIYPIRIEESTISILDFSDFDYIVDAIDDLKGKLLIIKTAKEYGVPVITSCGTGNKLNPLAFQIKDISKTSVCPLAKKLRYELKQHNISEVDALFSTEEPIQNSNFIASVPFVPSTAGILIARHIILKIYDTIVQNRIHLVLEGGGMKGVYTAGVLDCFLEHHINFDAVYGTSAGACVGASFVSKQKGRGYHAMVDYLGNSDYASKKSLAKTGNFFNVSFIYDKIPNELIPFDYDTAHANPCKLYAVVTNVETGKAEYKICEEYHKDIWNVCASSSIPGLSKIQYLDGQGYLDGGVSDPIPYAEAKKNANKCVVVLTKPKDYVCQKQKSLVRHFMNFKYRKYPNLLHSLDLRHISYNRLMKRIEKDKNTFIIRPSVSLKIDRIEQDKKKLEALYQLGYTCH